MGAEPSTADVNTEPAHKRTILATALLDADDVDGRGHARCFFQRLWLYDQIVFDPSIR